MGNRRQAQARAGKRADRNKQVQQAENRNTLQAKVLGGNLPTGTKVTCFEADAAASLVRFQKDVNDGRGVDDASFGGRPSIVGRAEKQNDVRRTRPRRAGRWRRRRAECERANACVAHHAESRNNQDSGALGGRSCLLFVSIGGLFVSLGYQDIWNHSVPPQRRLPRKKGRAFRALFAQHRTRTEVVIRRWGDPLLKEPRCVGLVGRAAGDRSGFPMGRRMPAEKKGAVRQDGICLEMTNCAICGISALRWMVLAGRKVRRSQLFTDGRSVQVVITDAENAQSMCSK